MYSVYDFTASSTRAIAQSDRLLTISQVERMLSAPNAMEAYRILNDLSWADVVEEAKSVDVFERVIDNGIYSIKAMLLQSSPSPELLSYLFLPFDLQNAKITLNAMRKGRDYDDFRESLSNLSFFSRRTAFSILSGETWHFSKDFYANTLLVCKKLIEADSEKIQECERMLDAAVYREMAKAVGQLWSGKLADFFKGQLDAENIKYLLRTPPEAETIPFLAPQSVHGFENIDLETARSRLEFSFLKPLLLKGERIREEGGDLTEVEVEMELKLLESLFWSTKIEPFGPETLALLFFTKLRNAEIIRMILVGKRSQFSEEKIRKMIAPFLPFLPQQ